MALSFNEIVSLLRLYRQHVMSGDDDLNSCRNNWRDLYRMSDLSFLDWASDSDPMNLLGKLLSWQWQRYVMATAGYCDSLVEESLGHYDKHLVHYLCSSVSLL